MSNTITTVSSRKPTEQQAALIKMATAKKGTTRAAVRAFLGYEDGANIPVQSMLKKLEQFGFTLRAEIAEGARTATYFLDALVAKPAKAKRAAAAASKAAIKTAKTTPAPRKRGKPKSAA
jgi:hypothetical protein